MAKYKALQDLPPHIKLGDIVEFGEPLVPEYQKIFEAYNGDEEVAEIDENDPVRTALINPSRDDLKKRATELDIYFAQNITTDKLLELVKDGEEALAAKLAAENEGGKDNEKEDDKE